ncbi:MAG: ABC-F family ATP-binding cassette domain-containing protein [Proteobacteria bacterium]|nr:ABC-F family ATP-binding cassette domain-containing protein [Pseudomonadota bacterium]
MPYISIKEVVYDFENQINLFKNISLTVNSGEKLAIIGDNGIGKTTLLEILQGDLTQSKGSIKVNGTLEFLPQIITKNGSVADILGISEKLEAINSVEQGDCSEKLFDIINNDWDIVTKVTKQLDIFNLNHLDFKQNIETLSGGEKVKLLLVKMFISNADFLLLDEPTNNLDIESKQLFYKYLAKFKGGAIIISHDRELLNKMDKIAEMKADFMRVFGGNYDFYQEIMQKEQSNLKHEYSILEKEKRDKKRKIQKRQTSLAKKKTGIQKKMDNKKYDPKGVSTGQRKQKAEVSSKKKETTDLNTISSYNTKQNELRRKLQDDKIKIPLPDKPFLKNTVLNIKNLSFGFNNTLLFDSFNLEISGGDRVWLKGNNGCGKTTLIKLILGKLITNKGSINLKGNAIFIDQSLSILDKNKTLLDNFLKLNPKADINDGHRILANFLFKNTQVNKKVSVLSGGELLKASLACILGTQTQPDLIILDEPTNNLDIKSIQILENSLKQYQGTLIIVSHDKNFIQNIRVSRVIEL